MNKNKILIDYILCFITCIFVSTLVILFIIKNNIFTKKNILETFEKENYYVELYNKTLEDMKDYMVSSGLEEEILENIFELEDIKKDVDGYISSYFDNSNYEIQSNKVSENIQKNIDKYLVKNNIEVDNKEELKMFLVDMENIYKKRINFYNMLSSFKNTFYKIYNLLFKIQIGLSILIIILNVILINMKSKHIQSAYMGSGLILLFTRFVIYDKIDFKNITLISDEFSKVLKNILTNIAFELVIFGIILFILGILIGLSEPPKIDGSKITVNRDNEVIKEKIKKNNKKPNTKNKSKNVKKKK